MGYLSWVWSGGAEGETILLNKIYIGWSKWSSRTNVCTPHNNKTTLLTLSTPQKKEFVILKESCAENRNCGCSLFGLQKRYDDSYVCVLHVDLTFYKGSKSKTCSQVSNRKLKLFELLHESGILHFHKYPWGSQIPLSDKS